MDKKINKLLNENNIRKYLTYVGIILLISSLTVFIITCLFNRPIADVFSYFSRSRGDEFWPNLLLDISDGHSGRFLQSITIWISHGLFHQKATIILPIVFIALFGLIIGFILKQLVTGIKTKYSLFAGCLVSVATIYTLPSFADNILWFDAMATYFTGILCLLMQILIFFWAANTKRLSFKQFILLGLCVLVCQFGTETTSLMSLFICLIFIIWFLSKKNWIKVREFLLFLIPLLSGLGLMIYGSRGRQGYFHPNRDPIFLIKSTFENFNYFFNNIKFWHLALIVFISIMVFYILKIYKTKIKSRTLLFIGILVILTPLLETHFVSLFALGSVGPIRNMFLPACGFTIGLIIVTISILKFMYYRISDNVYVKLTISIIILSMMLISAKPFFVYNYQIIQVSAVRARNFDDRAASITQQLSEGKKLINVESVTLEPLRSDAIDIKGPCLVSWQYDSFKKYYHIPDQYELVIDGVKMDENHVFDQFDYPCKAVR